MFFLFDVYFKETVDVISSYSLIKDSQRYPSQIYIINDE